MGFLWFLPRDVRVIYPHRVNCREMVVRLGEVEHMGAVTREKTAGNDKGHKYLALPGSGARREELALQIINGEYNWVDGGQDVFMLALTQIILHPN